MRGAALIISVLILTTVLLGLAIMGSRGFWNETNSITSFSHKKTAEYLALACMEEAIFRLGSNENYAGGETVIIGSETCTIRSVIVSEDRWTIETEASHQGQIARYRAVLSSLSPIEIVSWLPLGAF